MGHSHYKEFIFKSLQYLFIIKKPEEHKTITPNSRRSLSLDESLSLQNSEASSVSLFPCLSSSLLLMCPLHSQTHHGIFA